MPADWRDTEEDMPRALQVHVGETHFDESLPDLEGGIVVRSRYMLQTDR